MTPTRQRTVWCAAPTLCSTRLGSAINRELDRVDAFTERILTSDLLRWTADVQWRTLPRWCKSLVRDVLRQRGVEVQK